MSCVTGMVSGSNKGKFAISHWYLFQEETKGGLKKKYIETSIVFHFHSIQVDIVTHET